MNSSWFDFTCCALSRGYSRYPQDRSTITPSCILFLHRYPGGIYIWPQVWLVSSVNPLFMSRDSQLPGEHRSTCAFQSKYRSSASHFCIVPVGGSVTSLCAMLISCSASQPSDAVHNNAEDFSAFLHGLPVGG